MSKVLLATDFRRGDGWRYKGERGEGRRAKGERQFGRGWIRKRVDDKKISKFRKLMATFNERAQKLFLRVLNIQTRPHDSSYKFTRLLRIKLTNVLHNMLRGRKKRYLIVLKFSFIRFTQALFSG